MLDTVNILRKQKGHKNEKKRKKSFVCGLYRGFTVCYLDMVNTESRCTTDRTKGNRHRIGVMESMVSQDDRSASDVVYRNGLAGAGPVCGVYSIRYGWIDSVD